MGLWKQHFHWSVLLDWGVLAVTVPAILAVAGLLLTFDQYGGANVCFISTTCLIFAKIAQLSIVSQDRFVPRFLFAFLLFGLFGVAIVETVRGVNNWKQRKEAKAPTTVEETKTHASAMEPWIAVSSAEYPVGTVLGGILWSNRFSELRVFFVNATAKDYRDLDFTLVPDEPIAAIGQVTNLPNVSFSPAADPIFRQELIEGTTSRRIANPLVLIASTGGYRVRCNPLPRNTRLEILIAIARVIDFPQPGQKVAVPSAGVFDRSYALKLNQNDGIGHWYGHGTDAHGSRIQEVYKPERVLPKVVKIDGHYSTSEGEQSVTKRIEVKDVIGDLLKGELRKAKQR
jgi:hypothetical protein